MLWVLFLFVLGALANIQTVFDAYYEPYVHGTDNIDRTIQTLELSALTSDGFTALSHPRFPNHRVRIKQTSFCDPTVK